MTSLASKTPTFKLPNGAKIPAIGFGSGTKWQWAKKGRDESHKETLHEDLVSAVKQALDKGFRHVDTAEAYTTAPEIGEAVIRSGLKREDVFITDKYNPGNSFIKRTTDNPYDGLVRSLKLMKMEYVDLYLIHVPFFVEPHASVTLEEAWKHMEKLYKEGLAKNIGVSNFDEEHLQRVLRIAEIKPVVNQIEYHPYLPNQTPGIVQFCKDHDILVEAYSPLAPIFKAQPGPLDATLLELATKYGRSTTQILLRWTYQTGVLPVTTTSNAERCVDALEVYSFELSKEDVELISEVGKTKFFRAFFGEVYGKYDEELKKDYKL